MKSSIRVQTWIDDEKAKKLYNQLKSKKNGIEVALLFLAENADKNLLNSVFKNVKISSQPQKKEVEETIKKVIQEKNNINNGVDLQPQKKEVKISVAKEESIKNTKMDSSKIKEEVGTGKPIFNLKARK